MAQKKASQEWDVNRENVEQHLTFDGPKEGIAGMGCKQNQIGITIESLSLQFARSRIAFCHQMSWLKKSN
jgi:hypothetical protein